MKVKIKRVERCYACTHTVSGGHVACVTGQVGKSTHMSASTPSAALREGVCACVCRCSYNIAVKLVDACAHLRLREWISTS